MDLLKVERLASPSRTELGDRSDVVVRVGR